MFNDKELTERVTKLENIIKDAVRGGNRFSQFGSSLKSIILNLTAQSKHDKARILKLEKFIAATDTTVDVYFGDEPTNMGFNAYKIEYKLQKPSDYDCDCGDY